MTVIVATCRTCGSEFEPDRETILKGAWKTCPTCHPTSTPPPDDSGGRCRVCGRHLRSTTRDICLGCAMGSPAL